MDIAKIPDTECAAHIDGPVCILKKTAKKIGKQLNIQEKSPEKIIVEAKKKTHCQTEACVLEKTLPEESGSILVDRFKPLGPRNTDELFNNYMIDELMEQWSQGFENFEALPFQMDDFKQINTELNTWDPVEAYRNGTRRMGVVMNTDVSTGGGLHWYALFVDFEARPCTLEYFNSSGNQMRPSVLEWMIRTKNKIEDKLGFECQMITVSRIVHQKDSNTECGPYAMYYIYSRIHRVPYKVFNESRIPDAKMYEFRKVLFRRKEAE